MGKFVHCDTPNLGFHMEFDNGYKVSVQWASINYGSNRMKKYPDNTASTAEIMVTDSGGKDQEPIGWLTPNEVAIKLQEISAIVTRGDSFDIF